MTIGKRLNRFLTTCFKNQAELAKLLDIQQSSLSNLLNDKKMPSRDTLERLYELGCSIHWILFGDGEMFALNEKGKQLAKEHGNKQEETIIEETYSMVKRLYDIMNNQSTISADNEINSKE